jgi:prolyl-tRNA editing enzyme YbaK/EbsC (Cys-tRNA(Pro) deacylase)
MLSLLDPAVRSALETTGVACEVVACDPALADTAGFVQAYGYALEDSANTIVVTGKSAPPRYAACIVLANTRLDVNRRSSASSAYAHPSHRPPTSRG